MTEREKWDAFCQSSEEWGSGSMPWADGSTSTITVLSPPASEDIERLNLDPTGVYGRFTISCFHASRASANGGTFYFTITPPVPVEQLRAEAKARVDIPEPVIDSNPSFNDRFTIVRIPTWLWVDAGYWNGRYDGDSSAGFVTVEVWAEPVDLRWEFAGGEWVAECGDQPGTPWVPGAADTDCSVEFTRSSAGQPDDAFSGTATVFWQFRWSLNGADQGPFDELFEATTPFEIQVGEIQAVES